jgi:HAMP domain-containing protein
MDMRTLIRDIDSQVGPVSSELKSTLADARTLLGNVDKRIAEMQAGVDRTAKAAQSAMFRAENVFGSIESGTTGESSVIYQLSETLEEISAAAESIRHLADYLERHPEALSAAGEVLNGGIDEIFSPADPVHIAGFHARRLRLPTAAHILSLEPAFVAGDRMETGSPAWSSAYARENPVIYRQASDHGPHRQERACHL